MRGAHRVLLSGVTSWLTSWYSACVDWKTLVGWHQLLVETIGPARQSLGGFMRGKRMPCIRAAASIAVGIISGAGAAVPASIAGMYIARACLPGPISGEIVMGLLFLGGLGGVMFGLPCGTIGWFSCSAAMQRGWVLSVTLAVVIAVVVAASGTAVLYWLLIAPRATVPEHSVLIAGIALTIGVGASGAVSALASSAIALSWRSRLPTASR